MGVRPLFETHNKRWDIGLFIEPLMKNVIGIFKANKVL